MSTNYHTAIGVGEELGIQTVNERLADIDAGIASVGGAADVRAAVIYDEKATTVDGGGTTATTWVQRDLNTENDPNSIVAVASNQFTPIAGTYLIMVEAPAFECETNRVRLYNVTQSSVAKQGLNAKADAGGSTTLACLNHVLTVNGTDAFRIDHWAELTVATDGFGKAVGDGSPERYTTVTLIRLGD